MKSLLSTLVLALFLIAPAADARSGKAFEKLDGCHLMPNSSNDGDSFHVKHDGKEFIFRLYSVDAPESEARFPERVKEQAKYFGISSKEAIGIGKTATAFTRAKLAGKSFTVFTHWQDAMGQSRLQRHYAFVIVDNQNLSELLVANGLARIFGLHVYGPDGKSPGAFETHLHALENNAKHDHLGAWSVKGTQTTTTKKPDDTWDQIFKKRPAPARQP